MFGHDLESTGTELNDKIFVNKAPLIGFNEISNQRGIFYLHNR
jgi:hypothetical protein